VARRSGVFFSRASVDDEEADEAEDVEDVRTAGAAPDFAAGE
jgi:hypothetical protein